MLLGVKEIHPFSTPSRLPFYDILVVFVLLHLVSLIFLVPQVTKGQRVTTVTCSCLHFVLCKLATESPLLYFYFGLINSDSTKIKITNIIQAMYAC